jgi:signal transduction histidine kinase
MPITLVRTPRRAALKIALIYLLIGGLWIPLSDWAVEVEFPADIVGIQIQTVKGWAYVLITGAILYWLIQGTFVRVARAEQAMVELVLGTAGVTGERFFPALARHLAWALGVRHAIVAQHMPGAPTTQTLAFWSDDQFRPNYEYELAGTPCQAVVQQGRQCYVSSGVQRLFPADEGLVRLGAESYLGMPLFGSDGQTIGHMCVLDRRPLRDPTWATAITQIFAARAAAEIERLAALDELRGVNDQLQRLNETLEQRVIRRTSDLQEVNAELGAFTRAVSHDLRAPLRSISEFGKTLLASHAEQLDETGREHALRMVAAAARAQGLIGEMLEYSRLRRSEVPLGPVSSVLVAHEVIGKLQRDPEFAQADYNVHEPLPWVLANRMVLAQAMSMLLALGRKLAEPGAQPVIRIWAENRGALSRIMIDAPPPQGLTPTQRQSLTGAAGTDPSGDVTDEPGILADVTFVRRGIQRMGGMMGVELPNSPPATRFWFELPTITPANRPMAVPGPMPATEQT